MGIKGLMPFLKKRVPQVIRPIGTLSQYAGQRWAFDVSIYMYKYVCQGYSAVQAAAMFVNLWTYMRSNAITPIYVFDGVAPKCKQTENQKRSKQRKRTEELAKQQIRTLETEMEAIQRSSDVDPDERMHKILDIDGRLQKQHRKMFRVTPHHYQTLKRTLTEHAIPYFVAAHEGELGCCVLAKRGLVDIVISDDTDVLPGGAPIWIQWFKSSRFPAHVIVLSELLEALKMTHRQFNDFCILAGCDFCPTVPLVGPITAYKLLSKYESIDDLLSFGRLDRKPTNFCHEDAREVFEGDALPVPCPTVLGGILVLCEILSIREARRPLEMGDIGPVLPEDKDKTAKSKSAEKDPDTEELREEYAPPALAQQDSNELRQQPIAPLVAQQAYSTVLPEKKDNVAKSQSAEKEPDTEEMGEEQGTEDPLPPIVRREFLGPSAPVQDECPSNPRIPYAYAMERIPGAENLQEPGAISAKSRSFDERSEKHTSDQETGPFAHRTKGTENDTVLDQPPTKIRRVGPLTPNSEMQLEINDFIRKHYYNKF